jgi:hypothetical protein
MYGERVNSAQGRRIMSKATTLIRSFTHALHQQSSEDINVSSHLCVFFSLEKRFSCARLSIVPTEAPVPLVALDTAASVHRQCAPRPRGVHPCDTTKHLGNKPYAVLSMVLPVRETINVVLVVRVLPVDIFDTARAVRVEHGPR